ncbi:hypothetical protein PENSPDRAFT_747222 [Peniophora sp. CONT]|nr:hypothetical protein PENSPDRAFT_747222 [Peniophora sp. CONT]
MNDGSDSKPPENTQQNVSGVPQMTAEAQTQYLTSLAQTNPAAFAQVVQAFFQQQGSGVAAMLGANSAPDGVPPNPGSVGAFTGAVPQAGNAPYPQPFQQPAGASATSANPSPGMNLATDLSRLNYTSAIPPSRDYDAVVANRLRQADKDGKSYKDALREMHAVFNYPSNLWIDYYLDRRVSINELIDESERSTPVKTTKKPGIDRTASATASASAPAARPGPASMKKEKGASSGPQASKPRRATLNSMATFLEASPDPKDDAIPEPPSREPTPPTEVQAMGLRGNAFTDADVKYLVDFVNWVCAHKDWSVTKMYKKLYKRAPHHSAASWAGKAKTMPIIAKIIDASAQDEEEEEEEEDENYQEMDVDEAAEHSSSGRRRRQVGGIGTAITDDDFEKMADWIVENGDEWDEMSGKMRWFPFAEKYDKRSWQAWTEAYRRYQTDVDTLVRKKRRRAQASGPSGGKRPRND